ncbi:MAG: hypothetical protein IJO63_02410 [Bacilli bacterium]|nr:hypothetical protein [Bacilli bacterium]
METQKAYHLVLEARPGDFMPVDINLLLNNTIPINYTRLEAIDEFTKKYTILEIKDMIKTNNLVSEAYLNGKLQIINENKYRYLVMTSDVNFSFDTFLAEYIENKQIMNKFMNIYLKYSSETKELMKVAINKKDVYEVLKVLFNNEYETIRNIYSYMYENVILKNS